MYGLAAMVCRCRAFRFLASKPQQAILFGFRVQGLGLEFRVGGLGFRVEV